MNDMVNADLPEDCALSSDAPYSTSTSSDKSASFNKRKRQSNEVIEVLKDLVNSNVRNKLAQKKLDYLKEENERRLEERREQKHKSSFDEWQRLLCNIRSLCSDLKEALDIDTQQEIIADIEGCVKGKNNLARELGLK